MTACIIIISDEIFVCFSQSKLITSMLCEKPEDRPDSSKLKTELEKWAQILNAQKNMHQQNQTI